MTDILKIDHLEKVYVHKTQTIKALSDISLTVQPEEFICIIGPNGCGKSTLLKIIGGIEKASSGSITTLGGTSYLPQLPSLLPWRTVYGNLLLPRELSRASLGFQEADIKKWLKEFNLLDFSSMYPSALSGGMQQKVALIRTVLCNSSLLLLDEPFASLDAITRIEMQHWLLKLKKLTRSGVVCVTHDIHEALFLADTIYVLSQRPGQIKKRLSIKSRTTNKAKLASTLQNMLVATS
jgi:putative hydroxymethylpyrimidine transport system ATP-binding protein